MATLKAANASIVVNSRTGCITRLGVGGVEVPAPAGGPAALLEVADLRDDCVYDPLSARFTISGWKTGRAGGSRTLRFAQRYTGAPFRLLQSFTETPAGIRWEASLRLLPGEHQNRSLRVTWVLPAPIGWTFWSPQDTSVRINDGVTPQRYVYGHISFRPYGTMIPLVATWDAGLRRRRQPAPPRRRAALVAFSPPDVQKTYISFDLHTQAAPAPVRGIDHGPADLPQLRIVHHLVGLRPGKELRLFGWPSAWPAPGRTGAAPWAITSRAIPSCSSRCPPPARSRACTASPPLPAWPRAS